jgi:hypothetical protein
MIYVIEVGQLVRFGSVQLINSAPWEEGPDKSVGQSYDQFYSCGG